MKSRTTRSVTSLAEAAEEQSIINAMREARKPELSVREILAGLESMARSKVWWIRNFSTGTKKRPDNEIADARLQLGALVQAGDLLKRTGATDAKNTGKAGGS
jgi:hypothetical protein